MGQLYCYNSPHAGHFSKGGPFSWLDDDDDDNHHGHDNHKYHDPEIGTDSVELLSCGHIMMAMVMTRISEDGVHVQ